MAQLLPPPAGSARPNPQTSRANREIRARLATRRRATRGRAGGYRWRPGGEPTALDVNGPTGLLPLTGWRPEVFHHFWADDEFSSVASSVPLPEGRVVTQPCCHCGVRLTLIAPTGQWVVAAASNGVAGFEVCFANPGDIAHEATSAPLTPDPAAA